MEGSIGRDPLDVRMELDVGFDLALERDVAPFCWQRRKCFLDVFQFDVRHVHWLLLDGSAGSDANGFHRGVSFVITMVN